MRSLRFLGAAALVLVSTPALAETSSGNMQTTALTGPYIGVYGGYDWTGTDTSFATNPTPQGWEGGVFAGYKVDKLLGWTKNIGIGGSTAFEGFYGLSNADDKTAGGGMKKDNEWGLSVRPGISFLDSVTNGTGINPYMILGYRNTDFETISAGVSSSQRYGGFELGVGTELIAFGNAGLRLDYSHIWYASEGGIDPESNDLRAGVSYHF